MRQFKILALLLLTSAFFASCEKDDDDATTGPSYNFQEQPLQGVIGGEQWMMRDGRILKAVSDSSEHHFELWGEEQDTLDFCDHFFDITGNYIHFSLPLEEGLHTLGFAHGRTVTIWAGDSTAEHVADEGAVEITNIATTDSITIVSGRIDARADDDNQVNGDFEAVLVCD